MINVAYLEFKSLKRTRKVNGERVIELDIFPTENNKQYFDLVVEESILEFDGDEYVIKKLTEKSIGETYWKSVTAIHKFYVDLINKQQPEVHNGSITFNNYMNMVFEGTGYSYEVIDQFSARSFENLGNDNRLSLLQKGLERFKAELELIGSGYKARFRQQIGRDTDFQFRYGHNIKAISQDIDTTNLATVIRGTGDPELGIEASYTSDNVAIFGEIDAPPVNDERFKSKTALLNEMKSQLIDEPEVSLTIDYVDLRAAGYPYTQPDEGDRIWLIYEPMNDLLIETRILEINETFNKDLKVIKSDVTLSNYKRSFAGTLFDNVQKQLNDIVNDDGVIRYNVLDEAVKIATESLQSAQTELEFNNGIIAREKNDPNRLLVLNSQGIGISDDGGNTFREAITADGFVLTAGAIGRLGANNIQIGEQTKYETGYDPYLNDNELRDDLRITSQLPTSITLNHNGITAYTSDSSKYARLDHRGLYIKGGAIQIDGGLPDDEIANSGKWNKQGTYIDKDGVYTGTVTANQVVSGILRDRNNNTRFDLSNGVLRMNNAMFQLGSGADIRFTNPGNTLTYTYSRTAGLGVGNSAGGKSIVFMGTTLANSFSARDSSDFSGFVSNSATGAGEVVNTVSGEKFRVRDNIENISRGFEFMFSGSSGPSIFRPLRGSTSYANIGTFDDEFQGVYAKNFYGNLQGSSLRELKRNISAMRLDDSLQFVRDTEIVRFNWKDGEQGNKDIQVGFIIDDLVIDNEYYIKSSDRTYKLNNVVFMNQQVLQYALAKIDELEKEIKILEEKIA